jgi:DNA-binding response OmpR family regulator
MNKRVLIVEDDIDIAERLKDILELEDYDADIAGNGFVALNYLGLGQPKPVVILLDLMMPVMDGVQFCEEQQRRPDLADIPIVVMTAGGKIEEKVKKFGAYAYFKKPLDVDLLLSKIREL